MLCKNHLKSLTNFRSLFHITIFVKGMHKIMQLISNVLYNKSMFLCIVELNESINHVKFSYALNSIWKVFRRENFFKIYHLVNCFLELFKVYSFKPSMFVHLKCILGFYSWLSKTKDLDKMWLPPSTKCWLLSSMSRVHIMSLLILQLVLIQSHLVESVAWKKLS
jgi:hypothetical protein